uniref:DE-cadherin n=1 Tax=Anopheles minimus TaxID=112268 RepID=A0A182WJR5_9DIPT
MLGNRKPSFVECDSYKPTLEEEQPKGTLVLRVSATDPDPEQSIEYSFITAPGERLRLQIDNSTGEITTRHIFDRDEPIREKEVYIVVRATDNGRPRLDDLCVLKIKILDINDNPPVFDKVHYEESIRIDLKIKMRVATISASDLDDADNSDIKYEIIPTLPDSSFFTINENNGVLTLAKPVDRSLGEYYSIRVRAFNLVAHGETVLDAEADVKIRVVGNNQLPPYFTRVPAEVIVLNETFKDYTKSLAEFSAESSITEKPEVIFELIQGRTEQTNSKNTFLLEQNNNTATIKLGKMLDFETVPEYTLTVSIKNSYELFTEIILKIQILDENDVIPVFKEMVSVTIPENEPPGTHVVRVQAYDLDGTFANNIVSYRIDDGDRQLFDIDHETGLITTRVQFDHEKSDFYQLKLIAEDNSPSALYNNGKPNSISQQLFVMVLDQNDNKPKFTKRHYVAEPVPEDENINTIVVEVVARDPDTASQITYDIVSGNDAFDPDIANRDEPQHIRFSFVKEQEDLLEIDDNGCVRLRKALDRDPPQGFKSWQFIITATDEDGAGKKTPATVNIFLEDINDNAPHLSNAMPVVWGENRAPGLIVRLTAEDVDEAQNGPPFHYSIDPNAPYEIKERFQVQGDELYALVDFDREEQKVYEVPIRISDSGEEPMSDVSILLLVIGDENDNEMRPGESRIFVYNYKGESPNTEVGRVYVDDPDDWDLPDKTFQWDDATRHQSVDFFDLNRDTGMITMLQGTRGGKYELNFHVIEQSSYFPRHNVTAKVIVTVKEIPEEAVDKSGSIRFHNVTAEEFVSRTPGQLTTPKDRLQASIANTLNVSRENVDVFTVLKRDNVNGTFLDVRFSAHGSPYYAPERLNGMLGYRLRQLEEDVGLSVLMVGIDECIEEGRNCELSCKNTLYKSNVPIAVYTNTSSFVGVNAFVQAECVCEVPPPSLTCLNGGFLVNDRCSCLEGFEGPHCEMLSIGFYGSGYALYPPISPCNMTRISLELSPHQEDGLVMYIGPLNYNPRLPVQDFLALELVKGLPVLLLDYGSGTIRIEHRHRFPQGKPFTVEIVLQPQMIELIVDNCKLSTCISLYAPKGPNRFLNVNAPLQLGGTAVNLDYLGSLFNWTYVPQEKGFSGWLSNLTINERTYDLGLPRLAKNAESKHRYVTAAQSFGFDSNFLILIIIFTIPLIILLSVIINHNTNKDEWYDKVMAKLYGTVIKYEEEGGGESDVFYKPKLFDAAFLYESQDIDENYQDLRVYFANKKYECEHRADTYPVDDVRYYAYESDDGVSYNSLSSLTTYSDEDDLSLQNLPAYCQLLAAVYIEESSDPDEKQ